MNICFPDFNTAKVLVAGDVMLDRYWHGGTTRISPEAPVPVVKVNQIEERPGGAGNVALNIAHLGSEIRLVGLTGDDEASDVLATRLSSARVQCHFNRLRDVPTITKLRVISRHQQLIRLDFEEEINHFKESGLADLVKAHLPEANILVLSDYAKGALNDPQLLIGLAKEAGIPILVDPKGNNFQIYKGATILTPNLSEFEQIVGQCANDKELVQKGNELMSELELEALLITRGEQGMTLLQKNEKEVHFSAKAKEVYDVTGAGDTVIATLAAALAAGDDMISATALANLAASIVVGKLGTAAISAEELRRALSSEADVGHGVVREEQLVMAVQEAKNAGEKIVMTNGCFDILHAGHVSYLRQARELGDRLIVAVNDDASVKALKGEGRPVNPVERRMDVLAGLGSVDWVVSFSEDTPERIICKLLPDVLVKGGDYRVEDIAGGPCVQNSGGEVKVLGFEDGISTTKIINALKGED